ncbi:MAG: hypothetical protein A2W25_04630 [candidate division Zixibacteria bacterium RBG_16_53_22]|nr:MAG: hypothetical protein A2W25_04630 [candidate division Zixibacteria bacterium RBG_16_53_22]
MSFQPTSLQYNAIYYWRVVAKDMHSHETSGPVWTFSTPSRQSGLFWVAGYDTPGYATGIDASGEYAYLADGWRGLVIVNVSDPTHPVLTANWWRDDPGHGYYRVRVGGNYAYVATSGQSGFLVVDISIPSNPQYMGGGWGYEEPDSPSDIAVVGNNVFLAKNDVYEFNISDPAHPSKTGVRYTPGPSRGIFTVGSYIFIADGTMGLRIFLGSGEVGYYSPPGDAYDVFVTNGMAYVTCASYGLQVVDATDPHNPFLAGGCDTPGGAVAVVCEGNFCFVADGSAGLQAIDISNPASPTLEATYDTPGRATDVCLWNGYILVADESSGLVILEFVP